MCEYCRKRVCPNGCPNNYTPRGKKRTSDGVIKRIEFKTISTGGEISASLEKLMNIPLINRELTMKS